MIDCSKFSKQDKKHAILWYKYENPDSFDIECRMELDMEVEEYIQLRDELIKEGKLIMRVRRTYTCCRNEDGTITSGWVHHG